MHLSYESLVSGDNKEIKGCGNSSWPLYVLHGAGTVFEFCQTQTGRTPEQNTAGKAFRPYR
jgi:hypothetical protein